METDTVRSERNTCVVIPCYNEQDSIDRVIHEISEAFPNIDIIVVNDGSTDNTRTKAEATQKAIVLDLPANLGVGGAVQTGFKYAKRNYYDIVIKLDGDGQHDPKSIPNLIRPLVDDNADIVIGSRFIQYNEGFQSTFWRRVGIRFFEMVCRALTGIKITDATSGLRAYNRRAVEFMAGNYPSFDYPEPEEIILARKNSLRMIEVPAIMRERMSGESTISSAMSIYYMLKVTLSMIFISLRTPESREVS